MEVGALAKTGGTAVLFRDASRRRPGFRHIEPVFAEPAMSRDLSEAPHHRIEPAPGQGRHNILAKTARTAQFAGKYIQLLTSHHLTGVYQK